MTTHAPIPLPEAKPGTPLARVNAAITRALQAPPADEGASHLAALMRHLVRLAETQEAAPARDAAYAAAAWLGAVRHCQTDQVLVDCARPAARLTLPHTRTGNAAADAVTSTIGAWDAATDLACMIANGEYVLISSENLLEALTQELLAAASLLDPTTEQAARS